MAFLNSTPILSLLQPLNNFNYSSIKFIQHFQILYQRLLLILENKTIIFSVAIMQRYENIKCFLTKFLKLLHDFNFTSAAQPRRLEQDHLENKAFYTVQRRHESSP